MIILAIFPLSRLTCEVFHSPSRTTSWAGFASGRSSATTDTMKMAAPAFCDACKVRDLYSKNHVNSARWYKKSELALF
jgi:hypothetical protein